MRLDGRNWRKKLNYESIANKRLTWVYLQKPTHENMKVLEKSYLFHELDIEDCLSKIQIPKIDRHEDYIFILVHFPTISKKDSIPRSIQLAIFVGSDYLVTVHQGELRALTEMFHICKVNEKQRDSFYGHIFWIFTSQYYRFVGR